MASMSPRFLVERRDETDDDIVLRRGETVTLYYNVFARKDNANEEGDGMVLCSNLASSSSHLTSNPWLLKDLNDLKTSNDATTIHSNLSRLVCLDHVRSMEHAIRLHKKKIKLLENDLIGPSVGQLSIEEVRRRNQKLSKMKKELGIREKDEEIPLPWGRDALEWNAKGTIHLMALWETRPIQQQQSQQQSQQQGSTLDGNGTETITTPISSGMTTSLRIPIRPDRPNPKDPTRTCPLMLSCVYPESIVHSFTGPCSSPCINVPVIVRVTNGAPIGSKPLSFILDVQNDSENRFTWSGRTKSSLMLSPSKSIDVHLDAHFYSPGTYDLNQFRFHVDVRKNKRNASEIVAFRYPSLKYLVNISEGI